MNEDDEQSYTLTQEDREKADVLIIEPHGGDRDAMRTAMHTLGIRGVTHVNGHSEAIKRFHQRKYTHVIFDAKMTNMPMTDFVVQMLENDPDVILVASSADPQIDDVFALIQKGTKGFLAKPFTAETIEAAMAMAQHGAPIAESVLNARDRNEALVSMMATKLDKAAAALRDSEKYDSAKREYEQMMQGLRDSTDLAKTFSEGGEDQLQDSLSDFCIKRSNEPATRLGRLRKRLHATRAPQPEETAADDSSSGEEEK